MYDYDALIIGSGPAGEKAAIRAAKCGKKVGLIEKNPRVGGVCIHTGTLPSKTLREAVLYLDGLRSRSPYRIQIPIDDTLLFSALMGRKEQVISEDEEVISDQLVRNNIDILCGMASFADDHTLLVQNGEAEARRVSAAYVVIATGSKPFRPPDIQFDGVTIFESDSILRITRIPKSMIVIGGGVIGCEYACIFAQLGIQVTLVEPRESVLRFLDLEFIEFLNKCMQKNGIELLLRTKPVSIRKTGDTDVQVAVEGGGTLTAETLLYAAKRVGNIDTLNLPAISLSPNQRGLLDVNQHYQTAVPHIYAIGDVIGFPSLASTSMDQGRLAMGHAFQPEEQTQLSAVLPYGIYTIPEISLIGDTEESLKEKNIPYGVGRAYYREIARGMIIGDHDGMLKILFHRKTQEILGVHIIGTNASELIHLGQSVMAFHGTLQYFVDTVFNYPTLTEAYKIAALYGLNRYGSE